ncbi:MAG: tripartite tricarboxylate transporter TctB family protein [Pseudomonadota bacterium]
MTRDVDPKLEIAVCLAIVVMCGFVLAEAAGIPPGYFEPLGSGPVPRATAWCIITLCALTIARAVPRLSHRRTTDDGVPERWLDAGAMFALTVLYVAALHLRLTTFAVMTSAYLALTIGLLVRLERRLLPWVVGVALAIGFGSQYVFTRIFVVDLPGL